MRNPDLVNDTKSLLRDDVSFHVRGKMPQHFIGNMDKNDRRIAIIGSFGIFGDITNYGFVIFGSIEAGARQG